MTAPLAAATHRWRVMPDVPGRHVVPPPLRAVLLAGMALRLDAPVLGIVAGEREADELAEDVALFTSDVVQLPAWETLPFEHVSPNTVTMARRVEARHRLRAGGPVVVVASVRAVSQRLSPSRVEPIRLAPGASVDFDRLLVELVDIGYSRTDRVETRGEFAVRGGIIDVFPAQGHEPVRLDFWGDELDTIRAFAVGTQRSTEERDGVVVYPAREVLIDDAMTARASDLLREERWAAATWDRIVAGIHFPGLESWLPWLSDERTLLDDTEAAVVLFDPARAAERVDDLIQEESDLAAALAPTWGTEAPEAGDHPSLYLPLPLDRDGLRLLEAPPLAAAPGWPAFEASGFDAVPGDAASVAKTINTLSGRGIDVVVAMDGGAATQRVARLLAEEGAGLEVVECVDPVRSCLIGTGIHRGFVAPSLALAVVGEAEIAGRRRAHRVARGPSPRRVDDAYRDLQPGDYVVHHHHGIGRFEGLVHRTMAGVERDYLLIAYHGEDRLYVPTDQLAAVQRYTGGEAPRLSRMGGSDWEQTRSRVRKAVAAVAEEVVALHRIRAEARGHAFTNDTPWQGEFEALFPFEETPDQLLAIEAVKEDMERDEPMDRLIFGDVGFGKTEVAIRAMFKAVQDGKQAALLVPTTLLAQQHFATFQDRFTPYPIRVEMLSRFLTAKQQRQVVAGLAEGSVDVVIGTHRLLSDDIAFRDLGLLVIDEEQRFGVAAKDKLKALKASVDVLTLTATPIPRTLEMALTGIREVSSIRTAPEDRHPILTYVGPYDEQAVSAAIRRELLREGQVFYVHNRIQSIDRAVTQLRRLVPDARYAVAHGRMSEGQLEQVMYDFWSREYDVLVATTIIESGLDLPQVNTLIVERADRLGLAQLYQLRGRVGRSNQRAYAYLFHPPEERLGDEAYRRLEAIGEFSDLGSGFQLAMRDLEIRGAGSILSETQSGHIAAVGFDLYTKLVAEAVDELEGRPSEDTGPSEVRIDLPVDAHLPDAYVPTAEGRLEAYRRLAAATTPDEVADVRSEWEDRFGPLTDEATALIDVALLRVEALRIGIEEIVNVRNEVRIAPVTLKTSQEVRLRRLSRDAVLRGSTLYIPAPRSDVAGTLRAFLASMWPDEG